MATYKSNLIRTFEILLGAEGRAFVVSFKEVRVWKGLDVSPRCLRIDPTSTLLAVGAADGSLAVYDIRRGHCTHELRKEDREITVARFHPSRPGLLIYATAAGAIRVYDLYRDMWVF